MAPAAAAMRAMESLYPSTQIEAITRLTSGPLFQPFDGISGLQFPSFESRLQKRWKGSQPRFEH